MYIKFNPNPRENWRAGDCVVRAISAVTGRPWTEIYAELSLEGFYSGDWGNSNGVWDAYLRRSGFKRYICPNECSYCYSIADFAAEHPRGKYLAATGRHVVAIIDGDYWDSWDSGQEIPIYYYTMEEE